MKKEIEEFYKKQEEDRKKFFTPTRVKILNDALLGKPYILYKKDDEIYQKKLEEVGFVFSDIPNDDLFLVGKLPEGWTLKCTYPKEKLGIAHLFIFYDALGRERGEMRYEDIIDHARIDIWMYRRYRTMSTDTRVDDVWQKIEVYFGNEEEKIFVAGVVDDPDYWFWAPEEEQKVLSHIHELARNKMFELYGESREYAAKNYPDYEDFRAYWDDDTKKLIKG